MQDDLFSDVEAISTNRLRGFRIQKTLKTSLAMAAGVYKTLWSMDDLCGMMDAVAPKRSPRGPYKKREKISGETV